MSNWIWLDESISGTCGLMAEWLLPKCDILYPLLMVIVVIVEILLSQSLICTQFNWNFFASEKPCLPHTNEYYNCILILSYMVCILTEHTRTRVHCRICLTNWWALEIITYCDDISRIAVVSWFYRHCLFQNKYVPVYPLDCDMNSIFSRHDKQGKWMCRKNTYTHARTGTQQAILTANMTCGYVFHFIQFIHLIQYHSTFILLSAHHFFPLIHSLTHPIRCVFLGLVPLISIRKLNEPCFHSKQMYICPVNKHNTNTTQPFNRNVRAEFRKNKQKELNFLPIYIHRA